MEATEARQRIKELKKEQKALEKIIEYDNEKGKITNLVKSYEDACKILGKDTYRGIPYDKPMNSTERGINAVSKLIIIIEALNEGWEPNWNDYNEYKYYPWFEYNNQSGFGFSNTGYDTTHTYTTVGSRLVFKTRALAEYAGKNFIDIYNEWLINK